jgi:hypothetical protein
MSRKRIARSSIVCTRLRDRSLRSSRNSSCAWPQHAGEGVVDFVANAGHEVGSLLEFRAILRNLVFLIVFSPSSLRNGSGK